MPWGPLASVVGSGLGAGSSLVGSLLSYSSERQTRDHMRSMQQQAWAREDTAHQRAVADLRAAGLSPVLAAGSPAPSSSPVKEDAPNLSLDGFSQHIASLVQQGIQAADGIATINLKSQQAAQSKAQERFIEAQTANAALHGRELNFQAEMQGLRQKQMEAALNNDIQRYRNLKAEEGRLEEYMRHMRWNYKRAEKYLLPIGVAPGMWNIPLSLLMSGGEDGDNVGTSNMLESMADEIVQSMQPNVDFMEESMRSIGSGIKNWFTRDLDQYEDY